MKQRFVVVRSRTGPSGVRSAQPSAALDVDIEEVGRRELRLLLQDRDVVAVAPSMPMKLIEPVAVGAVVPAAPGIEWGVAAVGADTSRFNGEGIVACVLDTGIDADHPAFAGVHIEQQDFTGTGNGDVHGHGTHCAGTIFGRSVEGRRFGIAQGVSKALVGKVLGPDGGSSESIVSAIKWAVDSGANVISMSLGMDFPGLVEFWEDQGLPVALATSRALEAYRANVQLFERLAALVRTEALFRQPAIIVAAAGNESRRDADPDFEIAVAPPAVAEGIVSVAAVGESADGLVVAPFSNTGANVCAPGVGIVSARAGGGLASMSGTSMAAPHVAGVAALWAQSLKASGALTPLNLTSRLIASAVTQPLAAGFDPFDVGAGVVRAPQA